MSCQFPRMSPCYSHLFSIIVVRLDLVHIRYGIPDTMSCCFDKIIIKNIIITVMCLLRDRGTC